MRFGTMEILLILAIAIIVFGSDILAGLGKSLGTSIREFKSEIKVPDCEDSKNNGDGKSAS